MENRRDFFKSLFMAGASLLLANKTVEAFIGRRFVYELDPGPIVQTDLSEGFHFRLNVNQDFLLANPIHGIDGHKVVWEFVNKGNNKMSLGSKFKLGIQPVLLQPDATNFMTAFYNKPKDEWHVVSFIGGY